MAVSQWRPTLSPDYRACARAYRIDLAVMLLLYAGVSILAGRVWRFPFDDEIYTLSLIEHVSAIKLLTVFPATRDVHPPLSYFLFWSLQHLGLSADAMRLVSLALTASALALFQLLTLTLLARRHGGSVAPASRLIAALLFGLNGLAISQGDALRWYPLFATLVAFAITVYLAAGNRAATLASAVALGVAASTNVLAGFVALPLALYRYGLERRFHLRFEVLFWLVAVLFGALGLYTTASILLDRFGVVGTQLVGDPIRALLTDGLGFFGGHTLGIGQAWMIVPAVVVTALAVIAGIDRKRPDDPVHLLLLMLAAGVLPALIGFAKPRSFLYLAPVVAAVVTLYLDRLLTMHRVGLGVVAAALVLAPSIAARANLQGTTHPFKREAAIPYGAVLDFIDANGTGRELVISTDPVIPWLLRHQRRRASRCVTYFLRKRDCLAAGRRYDSVFVITGHSRRSDRAATMARFTQAVAEATGGRQHVATLRAGRDDDAALKSWLTGVPLGRDLLTIALYR